MPTSTQFPVQPSRQSDVGQQAWTMWTNVRYLASVFDTFVNKTVQGQAIITGGTTTVVVTHGLNTVNFQVFLNPAGNPGASYWVSNKTPTQFTINLAAAPAGSVTFDWLAKAV